MTNAIFAIFAAVVILRLFIPERWRKPVWMFICVVAFAQIGQKAASGVGILLVLTTVFSCLHTRVSLIRSSFFPLIYAAVLLVCNQYFKWNIPGFSYLVLASSLDLRGGEPWPGLKARAFSLFSFPKTVVGPISGARDHVDVRVPESEIFSVAFWGIMKAFIAVNLWRRYVPGLQWDQLHTYRDYAYFGLWNYVNLYLEFSGTCDVIAAAFWAFGIGCPLNFQQPYLAPTLTQFWQRWHITLSRWIKDCVYIPMGGSRVPKPQILFNLMVALLLSGAWHGLAWHYLAWGGLQGVVLCIERLIGHEQRLKRVSVGPRVGYWFVTQAVVTASWVVFFARF